MFPEDRQQFPEQFPLPLFEILGLEHGSTFPDPEKYIDFAAEYSSLDHPLYDSISEPELIEYFVADVLHNPGKYLLPNKLRV